jgi:hypothetical protein
MTFNTSAFALTCQENNRIYTPVVEFTKDNQRVLFIGMVHGGPRNFYTAVKKTMDDWISSSKGKTLILPEFFTCNTKALDTPNTATLSYDDAQDMLSALQHGIDYPNLLKKEANPSDCVLDIDGKTMRPAYLVERNKAACLDEHAHGLACQFGDLQLSTGKNIEVMPGDIAIDKEPRALQIVGAISYRGFNEGGESERAKSVVDQLWNQAFDEYMTTKRNEQLFKKTIDALKTRDQVILPWGADHINGLRQMFAKEGFVETRLSDIMYASAEDLAKDTSFDFQGMLAQALPRIGNCISPASALQNASNQQGSLGNSAIKEDHDTSVKTSPLNGNGNAIDQAKEATAK